METQANIKLSKAKHRGKPVITVNFDYNTELTKLIRQIPGSHWSQTLRTWYYEEREGLVNELYQALKNKARLDYAGLNMREL